MTDNKEIGKRFTEFINVTGLKQRTLAADMGVNETMINSIKNGVSHVQRYADVIYSYGCNLNWLLTGEGSMFADNERGRELAVKYPANNHKEQFSYRELAMKKIKVILDELENNILRRDCAPENPADVVDLLAGEAQVDIIQSSIGEYNIYYNPETTNNNKKEGAKNKESEEPENKNLCPDDLLNGNKKKNKKTGN